MNVRFKAAPAVSSAKAIREKESALEREVKNERGNCRSQIADFRLNNSLGDLQSKIFNLQ